MAISLLPVRFDEVVLFSVAEEFQTQKDENGKVSLRTSYDEESYSLDVQIVASVMERGQDAGGGQGITIEVPIEGYEAAHKKLRSIPKYTPITISDLVVRIGTGKTGKAYAMWSASGIEVVKKATPTLAIPGQRTQS